MADKWVVGHGSSELWVRDCPTLFLPCPVEFLEVHHRKEVLGAHLFLLKYGGSFDSVQVLLSPVDISKYPRLPYLRKLLCQHNFL